jgi:hypothetical protein
VQGKGLMQAHQTASSQDCRCAHCGPIGQALNSTPSPP